MKKIIKNAQAELIVWNYKDRLGTTLRGIMGQEAKRNIAQENTNIQESTNEVDIVKTESSTDIETEILISSCVSVSTSKSKSELVGTFKAVLAPTKNSINLLVPGSWAAILISNDPILTADVDLANPKSLKMIGRITSVRCETSIDSDGTRKTYYFISGEDWCSLFNNNMYIESVLSTDPKVSVFSILNSFRQSTSSNATKNDLNLESTEEENKKYTLKLWDTGDIITAYKDILNESLVKDKDINKSAGIMLKSIYDIYTPNDVFKFLHINKLNLAGHSIDNKYISKHITVKSNFIPSFGEDYIDKLGNNKITDAKYFLNPLSLSGTHSLWQLIMDASNPVLNETFCEMSWKDSVPELNLYNRIRPFLIKGYHSNTIYLNREKDPTIRIPSNIGPAYFQDLPLTEIDPVNILTINAGISLEGKYNFVDIRPALTNELNQVYSSFRQKMQSNMDISLNREGLRPLIIEAKSFPSDENGVFSLSGYEAWSKLLMLWFVDNHRMLNGSLELSGISDYIPVGTNIKFNASLLDSTIEPIDFTKDEEEIFILCHVESVENNFYIDNNVRTYRTTINFSRGILVDKNRNTINGGGFVDNEPYPHAENQLENIKGLEIPVENNKSIFDGGFDKIDTNYGSNA